MILIMEFKLEFSQYSRHMWYVQYTSKRMQRFVKLYATFYKNSRHTSMVCLWFCAGSAGICIAALLAKRAAIFAKRATFGETCNIFTGKAPQSLDCGVLQDGALSGIASKCGTHGGISAVHGTPC